MAALKAWWYFDKQEWMKDILREEKDISKEHPREGIKRIPGMDRCKGKAAGKNSDLRADPGRPGRWKQSREEEKEFFISSCTGCPVSVPAVAFLQPPCPCPSRGPTSSQQDGGRWPLWSLFYSFLPH